jgi:hypothetical protein
MRKYTPRPSMDGDDCRVGGWAGAVRADRGRGGAAQSGGSGAQALAPGHPSADPPCRTSDDGQLSIKV